MQHNNRHLIPDPVGAVIGLCGILTSVLIGVFGALAGLVIAAFIAGAATGAWITHLHYRAPP
jgi:hypothetical protein